MILLHFRDDKLELSLNPTLVVIVLLSRSPPLYLFLLPVLGLGNFNFSATFTSAGTHPFVDVHISDQVRYILVLD